jgi:hypothetical protein
VRPPWLIGHTGQDNSDLEVLQTDIMRFVAILGLCLAAIFSLVHTASIEQASIPATEKGTRAVASDATNPVVPLPPSESKPEPTVQANLESLPEPAPVPAQEPDSEPVSVPATLIPPDKEAGYSLGFASVAALQSLLQRGEVHLYAFGSETHYRYRPGVAEFTESAAPAQYYLMQSETVPRQLQRQLARVTDVSALTWGVVLPLHTVTALSAFLEKPGGGELLIDTTGTVSLVGS